EIDFLRKRFADENKWIIEIQNNKNKSQSIVIGLISPTLNRNPLGLDIYHDEDAYDSESRANNLSALEAGEMSPTIKQTIVNAKFESAGYPRGFSSTYSEQKDGIMTLTNFTETFFEAIPKETPFTIEMDLAPVELNMKYFGDPMFTIEVPNIGVFKAYEDGIALTKTNQTADHTIVEYFDTPKSAEDFYADTFTSDSRLVMEGDGRNSLHVRYGGKSIHTTYSSDVELTELKMKASVSMNADGEAQDALPEKWVLHKLDNLHIFYTK